MTPTTPRPAPEAVEVAPAIPEPVEVKKARQALAAARAKIEKWEEGRKEREKEAAACTEYQKRVEGQFLPCPHCGDKPKINWSERGKSWAIQCPYPCHNVARVWIGSNTKRESGITARIDQHSLEQLLETWNRRAV